MPRTTLAVVVTIMFSLVGVLGDYFLKLASESENTLKTKWFYVGFVVYASTAFGWVFVMKHLKQKADTLFVFPLDDIGSAHRDCGRRWTTLTQKILGVAPGALQN